MKPLRIGAYVRVSTDEQAALVDGSLDNQRYRITSFVDLRNVQEAKWGRIERVYVDDGYSAKDTRRPAFQTMMADLKLGVINQILVTDLSRLSRNIPDFCGILETLKEYGASFLSIKEQFDTSTPAGKMMLYNMINLAQFEREQTAERVALGCHARAMRGLLNGASAILGYDKSKLHRNTYVVNEEEAESVRTIFKTYLDCASLSRTVTTIEALGIKPKLKSKRSLTVVDRGLWTPQNLGQLLRNQAYVGIYEVNRGNKEAEASLLRPHQRYQTVKASWPAIVDQRIFDRVQALLAENRTKERRRIKDGDRRVFLGSGLIRCKACGRAMVGQSAHGANKVHRYYVHAESRGDEISCPIKRIRAGEIEQVLVRHLTTILSDGKYLDEVSKRIGSASNAASSEAQTAKRRLAKELATCEKEMESAFQLQISAGRASSSAKFLLEKLDRLGKKKSILEQAISNLGDLNACKTDPMNVLNDLEDRVARLNRGWRKSSGAQRRRLLRNLIEKIDVSAEGLDIYYLNCATGGQSSSNPPDAPAESPESKRLIQNCMLSGLVTPP